MKRVVALIFVLVLVFTFTICGSVPAESSATIDYPTKPIEFLVGWSPGGGSDLVARVMLNESEKILGQSVPFVFMPGGSGATAYAKLYNSDPDGYTLAICTGTITTHQLLGNLDFGPDDFEPIITINSDPGAVWVAKDAKWQTLEDLVEDARQNPETIVIASSNPGSITRYGTTVFEQAAGIKFKIMSESGGEGAGPQLVAGGHVDVCQAAPVTGKALYEAGLIRPLGVMSDERVAAFPDLPTYKEQGYDVTMYNFRQILAPKGTPKEIIDKLYDAFSKGVRSESYQDYMHNAGSTPLDIGPEETLNLFKDQKELFAEIIESENK